MCDISLTNNLYTLLRVLDLYKNLCTCMQTDIDYILCMCDMCMCVYQYFCISFVELLSDDIISGRRCYFVPGYLELHHLSSIHNLPDHRYNYVNCLPN